MNPRLSTAVSPTFFFILMFNLYKTKHGYTARYISVNAENAFHLSASDLLKSGPTQALPPANME